MKWCCDGPVVVDFLDVLSKVDFSRTSVVFSDTPFLFLRSP